MSRRPHSAYRVAAVLAASALAAGSLAVAQAAPGAEPTRVQPRVSSYPSTTYAVIKTVPLTASPRGIAVDSTDDTVYVAVRPTGLGKVAVIDGQTGLLSNDLITVGGGPVGIAINEADDTVYVTNDDSDTLSVINGRLSGSRSADVTIGVGDRPYGVAVDQNDDTVYVANYVSANVSVVDGRAVILTDDTILVGSQVRGVAVDSTDDTVYITNYGSESGGVGQGRYLWIASGHVGVSRFADDTITVGIGPLGVAVNDQDDTVYTANSGSNNSSVVRGVIPGPRSADDTIRVGVKPFWVAVDQTDDTVYVPNFDNDNISVINGRLAQRTDDTITAGDGPFGIAVDNAGVNRGLLYVSNWLSNNVSVIGRVSPTSSPSSGLSGSTVTLSLAVANLAPSYLMDDSTINAASSVTFGGVAATSISRVAGQNQWIVTAPSGAAGSTVDVEVQLKGGLRAYAGPFTFVNPAPTVSAISPTSGPTAGGTPVTVTGTGFLAGASVTIGGAACTGVTVVNSTTITCITGAGTAGAANVVVTNADTQSGTGTSLFTYVGPTPPPPSNPPGPPTNVTATGGLSSANISWNPPIDPGSFPVTDYRATAQPGGASCTAVAPATTCTITGLTNGTTYQVTVAAQNQVGFGQASSPASVTPSASITYSTPGLYMCTVDGTGTKTIPFTVKGGKGGTGNLGHFNGVAAVPNPGGLGASVSGSFDVPAGTKLALTVGNNGSDGPTVPVGQSGLSSAGGGGGYSSISLQPTLDPIVVAGGGGGGSYYNAVPSGSGGDGGAGGASAKVTPRAPSVLNWTGYPGPAPGWGDVVYGDGTYVAVRDRSGQPGAMTSPDGMTWTGRNTPVDSTGYQAWSYSGLAYGQGVFVGVGQEESGVRILRSADKGQTWTHIPSPSGIDLYAVAFGGGKFVAVGRQGLGAISDDLGLTWRRFTLPNLQWSDVTYGKGLFVAVASSGTGNRVMTSPNGTTWTQRSGADARNWRDVTYGGGQFVAVASDLGGSTRTVMTSPDGITWTMRTASDPRSWSGVAYGDEQFVAVANDTFGSLVMTSPDGITWRRGTSTPGWSWKKVTYADGQFVGVSSVNGPAGATYPAAMTSKPALPEAPVITATTPGDRTGTIAFTPPANAAATGVTNYEYQLDNGAWVALSPASTVSPFTISGLVNGQTYTVKIRAIGAGGAGPASNPATVTPGAPAPVVTGGAKGGNSDPTKTSQGGGRGGSVGIAGEDGGTLPGAGAGSQAGGDAGDPGQDGQAGGSGDGNVGGGGGGGFGAAGGSGAVDGDVPAQTDQVRGTREPTVYGAGAGSSFYGAGGGGGYAGGGGGNGRPDVAGAGGGGGGSSLLVSASTAPGVTNKVDGVLRANSTAPSVTVAGLTCDFGIKYLGNGNTAGTVPTDPRWYAQGSTAVAAAGSTLVRGAEFFAGWATSPTGAVVYGPGASIGPMTGPVTLWAVYAAKKTVTFDANGGTGSMASQSSAVATRLEPNSFTREDYDFAGWNTRADGTGTAYADGALFPFAADTTLYAQWKALTTVTFDANGGTGSMAQQKSGVAEALNVNTFTREGYDFTGWNTSADGTGTAYADKATFPFSSNTTLYAQWVLLKTVTFDANGGTGSMAPQKAGVPKPLDFNTYTREDDVFITWNTKADGTGTTYDNAATYNFAADLTLYAQWTTMPTTEPEPIPEPLEPGGHVYQEDGRVTPIVVAPNPGDTGLVVDDTGWTMTLQGLGAKNAPLPLSPTGALILEVERNARTTGTGFLAQSPVTLYMDPQVAGSSSTWRTVELGTATVGIDGTFDFTKPLPADIKPGNHVIQSVGYGPRGQRRTLSIGVVVQPWITLDKGTRKAAGLHDRITTGGDTGGIDPGTRLTPWIRYTGQTAYKQGGANIVVLSDGTYRWTRLIKKSKVLHAYVSWTDITSNTVFWAKVRR